MTSSDEIKGTYQEHKPCGYMLHVVNRIDKKCTPYLYQGEECMDKIIEQLVNIKSDTIEKMNVNKPTVLSEEEESEFRNATRCSNCKKLMNVMKKLEMPKHKIEEPKITNSSEVLSWGGCPKTTNNPRILSRRKPKAPIITLKKHPPQKK